MWSPSYFRRQQYANVPCLQVVDIWVTMIVTINVFRCKISSNNFFFSFIMYAYLVKAHKINSSFKYLVSKFFRQIIVKFVIFISADTCESGLILFHIYAKRTHN
jgi:hypothetical protein